MILDMVDGFHFDEFFVDQTNGFEVGGSWPAGNFTNSYNGAFLSSPNGDATTPSSSTMGRGGDSSEETEILSDIVLGYIGRMLMEEDIEEKLDMFQGHPALEATEKPFYEILNPTSPDQPPLCSSNYSSESVDGSTNSCSSSSISSGVRDTSWAYGNIGLSPSEIYHVPVSYPSRSTFGSTNNISNVFRGLEEPMWSKVGGPDMFAESLTAWQFRKGVEEASKFLPSDDKLVIDLETTRISSSKHVKGASELVMVKAEEESEHSIYGSRSRKNPHGEDSDLEVGRSNKQSAVDNSEETLRSDMFDLVLLGDVDKCMNDTSGGTQHATTKVLRDGHAKGSGGGKVQGKKQSKGDIVDLRTLLIHCAQAVASDDRRTANELLKQIRHHSSPFGDGTQRLAHCFADGLEARLAGTGSDKYHSLIAKQVTATDILKAYQLYMSACPFKKISHFFSNQTILNVTENASKVHIIDFGIYYGFQWPCFIKCLSKRASGVPKLRITGIEIPQPGFRPAERIEETGRRIEEYARSFGVPFEYHAIAAKWETITVDDLKIKKDEVLIVNCLFRLRNLADETVVVDCPRNMVLNTIRKLNPTVFIQGVVNGAYSAPFFVTRFREAMFHFSTIFDMLETNVSREDAQRLLIENTIVRREALNVIACEGTERVERPETYKQWQVRNHRAGFVQLPLDRDIMKKAKEKVSGCYHKDFVIDEDSRWLLQGWKGRITYALSAWKPNSTR